MRQAFKRAFAALLLTGCLASVTPLHAHEGEGEEALTRCPYCLCSVTQHANEMCMTTIFAFWTCFLHPVIPCMWFGEP